MPRVLRVISFALLASSAIGIALYGMTLIDGPRKPANNGVEERISLEEEQVSAIAGKANKQEVKTIAASEMADNAMKPPVHASEPGKDDVRAIAAFDVPTMEIDPPPLIGEADKEEVKRVTASDMAGKKIDEPIITHKPKPTSVSRVKKEATSKQRITKRRNKENVKISVPLVLVPPANVGDLAQSPEPVRGGANKKIKPVSEEPGKIIQNFGPPESNDHFRRK